MLKRYVIFMPGYANTEGGWKDVLRDKLGRVRSYKTLSRAMKTADREYTSPNWGYVEIVDLRTGKVVAKSEHDGKTAWIEAL